MSEDIGILLKIGGADYGGWVAQRVSRSIEQVAGGFHLELTDRWEHDSIPKEIRCGDECQIILGGEAVLTGYVDIVDPYYDETSHYLTVEGRDKTADLTDCSADVDEYEFADSDLRTLASYFCDKHKIGLEIQTDTGNPFKRFVVQPGETAFSCIERAARQRGVLCTTNGLGDLVLCSRGNETGEDLVEGVNILTARGTENHRDRFSIYKVNGQMPAFELGADDPFEGQYGEATDTNIRRFRPLVINCECYADPGGAMARANYECCCRAGRATKKYISVRGWRQSNGALWTPNLLVTVRSPKIYAPGINMIISAVQWSVDDSGTVSYLELTRPDAYLQSAVGEVEEDPFDA